MANEELATTIYDIYQKGIYTDYEKLRIDLENVNKQNVEKEEKFDIIHTSPLAAARRKQSKNEDIIIGKDLDAYGIILKVGDDRDGEFFPKIYIDVPVSKNIKPVEHPDYFLNGTDLTEFEHIIFRADSWHTMAYDAPIVSCLARIKLDPNFPQSTKYNKFLGLVNTRRIFQPAPTNAISNQSSVQSGPSAAEEAELANRKNELLKENDVKSITSLYYSLTMGQGKNFNNKKILSIRKQAIEDFMELDESFRLQAASLFNLAWENGLNIVSVPTKRPANEIADLYIYGRFCEETKDKKYIDMKLPYYNASDIGCSILFVGLDIFTLKTVSKNRFPYGSLNNLSIEKGVLLPPPDKKDPTLWEHNKDLLESIREKFFLDEKINAQTIQQILTSAIIAALNDGAKLKNKPTNLSQEDQERLVNLIWYDELLRSL